MTKRYIHCICPKHLENMKIGVYIHLVTDFSIHASNLI